MDQAAPSCPTPVDIDDLAQHRPVRRPTRTEAEAAVHTLLEYIGEDPTREGLRDTPKRYVKAFDEFFAGYDQDPDEVLRRTFDETAGYDDIVMLRGVRLESYCEHHIVPILGTAHVAYLPTKRVVGISKLARVVEIYAKRLQTQETLTAQITTTIERVLKPRGIAVMLVAEHSCMTTRGVHKPGVSCVTTRFTGAFRDDPRMEERFLRMAQG